MITTSFIAGSTGVISLSFVDEDGDAVAPNVLSWTLLNDGIVVNSRNAVSITPASTINIVLFGDDLVAGTLIIMVEGTYNSSYGTNMPLKKWDSFKVIDDPRRI